MINAERTGLIVLTSDFCTRAVWFPMPRATTLAKPHSAPSKAQRLSMMPEALMSLIAGDRDSSHLSPLGWKHVNLTGDYI
jgi:hypothetical protein